MRRELPNERLVSPVTPGLPVIEVTTTFCNCAGTMSVRTKSYAVAVAEDRDVLNRQHIGESLSN